MTFLNRLKGLASKILSLLTFGIIKADKFIGKEYRIELLKVDIEKQKYNIQRNFEKQLKVKQEKAVLENTIERLTVERKALVEAMEVQAETGDTSSFTESANRVRVIDETFSTYKEAYASCETVIASIETIIQDAKSVLADEEVKLKNLAVKQKLYEVIKETNNIIGDVAITESGKSNLDAVKEDIESDIIRERVKHENIAAPSAPRTTPKFAKKTDMKEYLKTLKG